MRLCGGSVWRAGGLAQYSRRRGRPPGRALSGILPQTQSQLFRHNPAQTRGSQIQRHQAIFQKEKRWPWIPLATWPILSAKSIGSGSAFFEHVGPREECGRVLVGLQRWGLYSVILACFICRATRRMWGDAEEDLRVFVSAAHFVRLQFVCSSSAGSSLSLLGTPACPP